jgi:hypothetical protein
MRSNLPTLFALLGAATALASAGCPTAPAEPAAETGPAIPATTPIPTAPDPQALYDGFTIDHPWRAVLASVGRWKLTPQEEWREPVEGASSWVPFDVLVMDPGGAEVRVVAEREDMLYAVWIPREDLAQVPVQAVTLAPTKGSTPDEDEPGVQLAGGTPIETLEQQGGWTRVRTKLAELVAEGWIPDTLLGRMYRQSDFVVSEERVDLLPEVSLEVRDAPSPTGALLATLRPDAAQALRVRALAPAANGWREIRYPNATAIVRGFVQESGLATASAENPGGSTHTISANRVRGDFAWLQVPVTTEIRLSADGDVFAVTTMGTKLIVAPGHTPNRTPVTLKTIWGDAPGFVSCEPIPEGMNQPVIDTCVPPFEE